jgi:hypothetical protein
VPARGSSQGHHGAVTTQRIRREPPHDGNVRKRRVFTAVGVLAAFLIGLGVGGGSGDTSDWANAPVSPSTTVTNRQLQDLANPPRLVETPPAPPSAARGSVTSFDAGTFVVGTGIEPGTYSSSGPDGTNFAGYYWSRLRDTSGDFGAIIANNVGKGPAVVTINASDGAFKTEGCSTWHKAG